MLCIINNMKKFDLQNWLEILQTKLRDVFSENLLFLGYHGSYTRQEAAENSDVDVVIILKELTFEDLRKYKTIIDSMPFKEKCCGFISGKDEIINWSKTDVFQFYYETKSLYGNIKDLITPPSKTDTKTSIKMGLENLYHAAIHSFLYDNDIKQSLINLYKMSFFILQQKYFLTSGKYIPTKKELLEYTKGTDSVILNTSINRESIPRKNQQEVEKLYQELIEWCTANLKK